MPPPARLLDHAGRGYAVVESLPSLGKGRRCTGIFLAEGVDAEVFREALTSGEPVAFRGTVHHRHRSERAELEVAITRVEPEGAGLRVEFSTGGVPYDVIG